MRNLRPFSLRAVGAAPSRFSCGRRFRSDEAAQATEGEIVLLKNISSTTSRPILTPPLYPGYKISLQSDSISHDDIIGKALGSAAVVSRKRAQYRIHRPTLGEYTDNSPRIVTPIYSQDATLIVSLLDLHPSVPGASEERIEIFEAGTGHGALTLFLARALHGANTAAPEVIEDINGDSQKLDVYNEWLSKRRAVVHTLDISERHSKHARSVVRGFRRGIYYPNVDFHVGEIDDYISCRLLETDGKPFLSHAILDLPDTHHYMELVSKVLKPNGILITFSPSITQINSCFENAKIGKLPLFLDPVLEIGGAIGVGGREWDVRRVKIRDLHSTRDKAAIETENSSGQSAGSDELTGISESSVSAEARWEMVCRPKVGVKVVGGGFVGVWRKKSS